MSIRAESGGGTRGRALPFGLGARVRRVPPGLAPLLMAVALIAVGWALLTPPFQAPDESAHFAYVQSLAESFELPPKPARPQRSTEQQRAADASNADGAKQTPGTDVEWSSQAETRWERRYSELPKALRSDGGGPNPSEVNPPLYYLYEAGVYRTAAGASVLGRLTLMRIASGLLLVITALGAWLLAGELFGRDRGLQAVAAAVAGMWPMVSFVSASVTPDALLFALWSLALWLGVRIIKRGPGRVDVVALAALVGLAIVTKAPSYALVPAAALAIGIGARRHRRQRRRRPALAVVAVALALLLTVGLWFAAAAALDRPAAEQVTRVTGDTRANAELSPRGFASYLWQYYLPRLPGQQPFGGLEWPPQSYEKWLKHSWGAFGWLEVRWPPWLYPIFAALTAVALLAALAALVRRRRLPDLGATTFLLVAAAALLGGLHWADYRYVMSHGSGLNQGRYLFPLIALAGVLAAAAVTLLPKRARAPAVGALIGSLLAFQLLAMGLVAARFYA